MEYYYTAERNVQMLIYLLKAYNIRKVIASPGATNVSIVSSMQQDSFFEMYSCVDERSAGYMAVGMAYDCGEPVILSCTGATSARNYMPALTEAFYRKLPIIAITSTQDETHIGHLIAQVTDRRQQPKDVVISSVYVQNIRSKKDEWDCCIKLNRILQAFYPVAGPIHINLATGMGGGNNVKVLPKAKVIKKYLQTDQFPKINLKGNIAIFVGSHNEFSKRETEALDRFCSVHNAVVFCDHTSSYKGNYRIMHALIGAQEQCEYGISNVDLLIHIGEVSGDYDTLRKLKVNRVWRVNPDGEFRDTYFGKLDKVFQMSEVFFFEEYSKDLQLQKSTYYEECYKTYMSLLSKMIDIPFSNIFCASILSKCLPNNSILYLGILNSLRSWNFFNVPQTVQTVCNVGGFGIDGIISSLVGASLVNNNRLYFGVVGDLSFFYDMNSIGNRHIGNNLRLLVINNGHGQEFEMYNHAASFLGKDVNKYVAAEGHFGHKSKDLIKHYAEDLGFEYMSASTENEFYAVYERFVMPEPCERSIVFEVFTDTKEENRALYFTRNREATLKKKFVNKVKNVLKK